ncbi:MAG: phosphoglycerate dehydrogenase [Gammaproteobacteria bacterium]|nr:phosphoglycerate dehydrogenase [Gammaproteobacteria bacterium]NNF61915.1 phosphoglycerate dehydrogenase [Gammaproteobacteria bacterium]NNM19781.1 phosphoglycerate dehydrogenase [Gammaproteobacteria bacterium]
MSFKVLTLNNISLVGLERLPRDRFEVASEIGHPDAILLRSHKMHDMELPDSVKVIGRAGAGVNNIPVDAMTKRGIPVLNAPGANANAVKELVIAGMLLGARNLCQAWHYVQGLEGDDAALHKAVESGKKKFRGIELPGRTLGVIGLGAIGVEVANAALSLGMEVIGFDPHITVHRAWQLSSGVEQADSLDQLCRRAEFLTLHVPLVEGTRNLIDADKIGQFREGAILLNFARGGIVDETALREALDKEQVGMYVTDFPTNELKSHPRVTALPHLGASTGEAEDNCAVMVAQNVRDFLENGNVRHSVNFPAAILPRTEGYRLAIANANVPNMLGQISTCLADSNLNIVDMLNKSRGDVAYTLVDVEAEVSATTIGALEGIDGVLNVRAL